MPSHAFKGKKGEILDLLLAGKSAKEIIAITHYPPQYVYNVTSTAKKMGLQANSTKASNAANKTVEVPYKTKQASIPSWISARTASRAFRLLDQGHPATDLVIILKLPPDDACRIANFYHDLRNISAKISKQPEQITARNAEPQVEMSVEYARGPVASDKPPLGLYWIPAPTCVRKPAPPPELNIEEILSHKIRAQGYAMVFNALYS